jgi:hypothetical protein
MKNSMRKTMRSLMVIGLALSLGASACAPGFYGEARMLEFPPPLVPIVPARATIIPYSQAMSLALFNFVDQTGKAGQITEALPDALSTLVYQSGRFAVRDRGQLRHDDYGQLAAAWQKHQKHDDTIRKDEVATVSDFRANRAQAQNFLKNEFNSILATSDAIFIGAVTEITEGLLSVDYRVINSQSRVVLYAASQKIRFTRTGAQIEFERDDLKRLVRMVLNAFPDPKNLRIGQVLVQDGRILTVNLGRKDKIMVGLNALVLAPGEQVLKTAKGEEVRNVMYLGEAYVVAVYENSCKLVVFHHDEDYRVGDNIKFK